jgi:HD-like signal output (HDOD) protein
MLTLDTHSAAGQKLRAPVNSAAREQQRALVTNLAETLSQESIELLGYPEVAVRVQRALTDENVSLQRVISILGSEPVLAGRVIGLANSAALNSSARPITDLRTAVMRVGLDSLRAVVMCHAFAQLNATKALKPVRSQLRQSWQHSVVVAALCAAIARRRSRVNPETALLTGLMHGVGRLYILVQARDCPELLADTERLQEIFEDWQMMIGRSLLQQWQIPAAIATAVVECDSWDEQHVTGTLDLSDILFLADLLVQMLQDPDGLERALTDSRFLTECSMTLPEVLELTGECEREIAEVIAVLDLPAA